MLGRVYQGLGVSGEGGRWRTHAIRWLPIAGILLGVLALSACGAMQRHHALRQQRNNVAAGTAGSAGAAASSPLLASSLAPIKDADLDGIADTMDRCPNTPKGLAVDSQGCTVPVFIKLTFQYGDNETTLPAAGEERLAAIAELLRSNPDARLRVDAHTDNRGTDESNLALSQARAQAIREVLEGTYRVPAGRIVAEGHGAFQPLVSNAAPQGQARNRRAELVLTGSWHAYAGDDLPGSMLALKFSANGDVLTPQSRKSLEAIGRYLRKHPDVQARVTARHGDEASRAGAPAQRLGKPQGQDPVQARAETIQAYLARLYGVPRDQLAVEFLDLPATATPRTPAASVPAVTGTAATGASASPGSPAFKAICFETLQTDVQANVQAGGQAGAPGGNEALKAMDSLGRMLSASPHLRCILAGHTDDVGPEEANLRIARERAESVRQYLLTHYQLAPEQLEVRAFGESSPLASNETEEGRRQNRRVEFQVLGGQPAAAE
ncbi:OmpA family protein [Megalodesulfovibrio paquesii]